MARRGEGSGPCAGVGLPEEALLELGPRDPVMRGNVSQDRREGAYPKWTTGRNGDTVLT